ncbi:hypothetical protein SNE40_018630 [Patella caerulea]
MPTYCARSMLLKHIASQNAFIQSSYFTSTANNNSPMPSESSLDTTSDYTVVEKKNEGEIIQNINTAVENKDSRLFAVVHICGKQYKITTEDIIMIKLWFDPTIGDKIRLEKVLMVGGKDYTLVGRPILSRDSVKIEATVVEKTLSHYRVKYKYRKRKRVRRFKLSRNIHTMLVINSIEVNPIKC